MEKKHPLIIREKNYTYDESIPIHFDNGNVVLTAEWNAFAMVVVGGERFFIRSVKKLADRATNPDLHRRIHVFLGQEAMHAKETTRMLEPLRKRGFPVPAFMDWQENLIRKLERWLPFPTIHLKSTVAMEHYTLLISLWYLGSRYGDNLPPPIRDLWNWHFAEELEHKSVAYDLLEAMIPQTPLMRVSFYTGPFLLLQMMMKKAERMILKWEGLSRSQIRKERRLARKIRPPLIGWRIPHLWDFLKPDFHPDRLDDGRLSQQVLDISP